MRARTMIEPGRRLRVRTLYGAPLLPAALAGCSAAPSQNILGSYFPSWMLCALAGIGATIVVRQLLVAAGLDKALPAPLVVYLALAVAFAFASWLIWLD
jgi:YtcA family